MVLVCPRAARLGVHPGMALPAARALLPELTIHHADPEQDRATLERLACWAGQFTSAVSLAGEGLLLDIAGSLRLFGGLAPLLRQVRRGVRRLGYRLGSTAVAPTPQGAWLLARAGDGRPVLEVGALSERIGALPVAALDVAGDVRERLAGVGVRTIGDLLALPRGGVVKRFGAAVLDQVDRALGSAPDPRPLFVPPDFFSGRLALPAEVREVEPVLFGLRRLLTELHGFLAAKGQGVDTVTLHLHHPEGGGTPVILTRLALTRDDRHLFGLFRERLGRQKLAKSVDALALTTGETVPLAAHSLGLFGGAPPDADGQLLERIRARLGEAAVTGIHGLAEHRPERAWQPCAPGLRQLPLADGTRPLWLLREPRPLPAAGGLPCRGGPLTLTAGPERIESGWWDGVDVTRDYYIARHGRGGGYWVFRDRDGAWFLHGVFA
ncbi:MAG: DNA polymerase Y family protein [Nitrospirae bacterium]|nr:DNA polymerase Y family protein [Nitrospirota bacterium]